MSGGFVRFGWAAIVLLVLAPASLRAQDAPDAKDEQIRQLQA